MSNNGSNVSAAIGRTPLVDISGLRPLPHGTRLLAKVEGCNPGGSIKDRAALYMIRDAEQKGLLRRDQIILEPTSGNTGIALAMIGAALGYRVHIVMPACVSQERRAIIGAFGADMDLTPAEAGTDGAIAHARELTASSPWTYFMPDQFSNPANIRAHYETTGPEIFRQTEGKVDVFVAGIGTGGTLMGAGGYLREMKPGVKVFGVEPPVGHRIQGLKNLTESEVPKIFDRDRLDGIIGVDDDEAFAVARALATGVGLFAGISSGAAVAGAWKVAPDFPGATIVTILPDRGERYLSTELFRSYCSRCRP
ncbi:MAG: cysteine synthase family protein [Candidatus Aminicenantes bacterium]|nr:cysteine synthase family protein [Candidatus Aminicenantes bacterium]